MSKTNYKIGLEPVNLESANDKQKSILKAVKEANGMIPNMYKNMVNLPGLQETYDTGYNNFRKNSGFNSAEQEVVLLTISIQNGCEYCTAAHSYIAENVSKTPEEVTKAIREETEIPDSKLKALSDFTKIMNSSKGNPSPEEVNQFLDAGYSEKHILAIILALATKTISNYSNHIFHTKIDDAFAEYELKKA